MKQVLKSVFKTLNKNAVTNDHEVNNLLRNN